MPWTTADLVDIDDQKKLVIFTVVFGRDDGGDQVKQPFTANAELGLVTPDWLSQQATAYINKLNGVEVAKGVQKGPIHLLTPPVPPVPPKQPDPTPEELARLAFILDLSAAHQLKIAVALGIEGSDKVLEETLARIRENYLDAYLPILRE